MRSITSDTLRFQRRRFRTASSFFRISNFGDQRANIAAYDRSHSASARSRLAAYIGTGAAAWAAPHQDLRAATFIDTGFSGIASGQVMQIARACVGSIPRRSSKPAPWRSSARSTEAPSLQSLEAARSVAAETAGVSLRAGIPPAQYAALAGDSKRRDRGRAAPAARTLAALRSCGQLLLPGHDRVLRLGQRLKPAYARARLCVRSTCGAARQAAHGRKYSGTLMAPTATKTVAGAAMEDANLRPFD